MRPRLAALCAAMLVCACGGLPEETPSGSRPPSAGTWFETVEPGLDWMHVRAPEPRFWFPEIMSGGAAWLDYDGDGDDDLYLVQGGDLAGHAPSENRLFRNEGNSFVDVTREARVGNTGYGMGAVVGDLDGDGYPDLYVTNVGPNVLYRNLADGTFREISAEQGGDAADPAWGTSGAALDYDADGDLDLFVVNYVTWSPEVELECYGVGGGRDYCHPSRYQAPAADLLLRNDGGFSFTDVSERVGLLRRFGNGLGVAIGDFTATGRTDIYVANDGMPNQLWTWSGGGFKDVAVERGCAVSGLGAAEAGMGVAHGDADGDGTLDLFVTHLGRETNTLYLMRDGICSDATAAAGLAAPSLARTGFGTGFADFDHDGALDLWVGNGRVGREDLRTDRDPFAEPDQIYRGLGGGRFELMSAAESGVGATADTTRGTAFADFDGDGDVDVVTVTNGGSARLYRNRARSGSWIQVLVGSPSGAEILGARVMVRAGGMERHGRVQRAYSYCSSSDPRVHFGLGKAARIEEIRVETPGGQVAIRLDLPPNRVVRLNL